MKPSFVRRLFPAFAFLSVTSLAWAHPGHDGHELTWDLGHLAQHPLATIGCAAVAGAVATVLVQTLRRRSEDRAQTLRVSQRIREK